MPLVFGLPGFNGCGDKMMMKSKSLKIFCIAASAAFCIALLAGFVAWKKAGYFFHKPMEKTAAKNKATGNVRKTADAGRRKVAAPEIPRGKASVDELRMRLGIFEYAFPEFDRHGQPMKHMVFVPEMVRPLFSGDACSFQQKQKAVNSLGSKLPPEEVKALYRFVMNKENSELANALKNDCLNILRKQEEPPKDLADVLVAISRDGNSDIVIRDYSIQHLRAWYKRAENDRTFIREALYETLKDRNSQFSGTALLAVCDLLENYPDDFDRGRIEDAAVKLASDDGVEENSRITATQVCGKMGIQGYVSVAREGLNTGSSVVQKLATIATIGDLGDKSDIPVLEDILGDKEAKPLHVAAKTAIKRIQERN